MKIYIRLSLDPVGVPVVSMEFVNKNSAYNVITMVYEDDYDCYGVRYVTGLKMIKAKKRPYYTVSYNYIVSGGMKQVTTCAASYSFKMEDMDYKMVTDYRDNQCSFQLLKKRRGASSGDWVPVSNLIKRKQSQPVFDNDGPWCEASPNLKGSSSLPVPRGNTK